MQPAPHRNGTLKDFKLVRYACDLRVSDRWRHPCAPQGREKMMRSKHLHVHCTCTARALCTLAPFFIRCQVGLAQVHTCTEFGVASSKFTFTGGPHAKTTSSPLARAAGTRQERHPQWILSWCSTCVTCEFGFSDSPRLTSRGARKFLVDLHAAARATCHVPPADPRLAPMSFRRFGASTGATPVPIGPAVRTLFPKILGQTH